MPRHSTKLRHLLLVLVRGLRDSSAVARAPAAELRLVRQGGLLEQLLRHRDDGRACVALPVVHLAAATHTRSRFTVHRFMVFCTLKMFDALYIGPEKIFCTLPRVR